MRRAPGGTSSLTNRAYQGWRLLRDDPSLHPADVLAAIVWPQREELQRPLCECGRVEFRRGLCYAHYYEERKAAA